MNRDAGGSRSRGELRIVAQNRVQSAPDLEATIDGVVDERAPTRWKLTPGRGDADQQCVRPAGESVGE